jgi:hypothetical protein
VNIRELVVAILAMKGVRVVEWEKRRQKGTLRFWERILGP